MIAGLLAAPAAFTQNPHAPQPKDDPRLTRLKNFFAGHASPLAAFAQDFLSAADRNGLDWRLLPSISMVETSGGKTDKNNNIFGWNSGRSRFSSVHAAIRTIAAKLSTSRLYRHKDVDQILRTYNKRPQYAERVKTMMRTIGQVDLSAELAALN